MAVKAKMLRCFVCFAVGQVLSKKIYRERLTRVHEYKYENIENTNIRLMRKECGRSLAEVISTRLLNGEIIMKYPFIMRWWGVNCPKV